jgi:transmembrane sensor
MKTNESFEADAVLDERAANWLVEREEGFSPGRAEEFAAWYGSDPRHADAVARVEGALDLLNEMPSVRATLEERTGRVAGTVAAVVTRAPIWRLTLRPWASGIAAALMIGAAGLWIYASWTYESRSYSANSTAPQRVALTDGSVVDLNANSRMRVKFSSGERQLDLSAGEAHFQVAHNAARPFIVTAHGVLVRAVGTAFDVRLVGDNVEVLVTEGKVDVGRKAATALFSSDVTIIPHLSAGERTLVTPDTESAPPVESVPPVKVHDLLSWQDRMTSFTDVPLREMVTRVNRCNAVQLVIADPTLAERRIGGAIALDQVDAFVRLLEKDGDIAAERRGAEIVLRRAR